MKWCFVSPPKLHFVLRPVSLTDARHFFVSVHFPWPPLSAVVASSFTTDPHIVVVLIRSAHTLRKGALY